MDEAPPNTARSYRTDLAQWVSWLTREAPPEYRTHPLLAGCPHVARWRRHLEEKPSARTGRPLAAASVAREDALGHADPRTTRRYDRGRHNLDRSPAYKLAEVLRRT